MSTERYDKLNPHTRWIEDRDIVLFSGGVDSTAVAAHLKARGKNPLLLFVDTGCEDIMESRVRAIRIAGMLGLEVVEDDGMSGFMSRHVVGDNLYIPFRNLLFAIVASGYGRRIWLGGVKGDFSPDKSPEAFRSFLDTLQATCGPGERVESIDSPFWDMDKVDVARELVELEGEGILKETLGCYHPLHSGKEGGVHCGRCSACFRRFCLFEALGIDTAGEFREDPVWSPAADAYLEMLVSGDWRENLPEQVVREVFVRAGRI